MRKTKNNFANITTNTNYKSMHLLTHSGIIVIREKEQIEKDSFTQEVHLNDMYINFKKENLKTKLVNILDTEKEAMAIGSANFKIVFKSKSQEHSFNFPFQIGTNGDSPEEADSQTIPLLLNDLVILGTDGLFDNLYDKQILEIVETCMGDRSGNVAQGLSDRLANLAYDQSLNKNFFGPFCLNAMIKAGSYMIGGKSDDITVVVGQVFMENQKDIYVPSI